MQILLKNKKIQRTELLAKRRALSLAQKREFSASITQKIMALPEYQKAKVCFMYAAMPDEYQTRELVENALKAGKRICLPYIADKTEKIMLATELFSWSDLIEGTYGILSLPEDKLHFIEPEALDLVIVPAVGFDKSGYRLGMGGGYYDRYLLKATNAKWVAGVYNCQIVPQIIKDEHDAQVDIIVTEQEVIRCK